MKVDEQEWMEGLAEAACHLYGGDLSPKELRKVLMKCAEAIDPERVERFKESLATERIAELIECLLKKDMERVFEILEPLSDDVALKVVEVACEVIREAAEGVEM